MITTTQFYKRYGVINTSKLQSVVTHGIDEFIELPPYSVVHIFDSLYSIHDPSINFMFNIDKYPYFRNNKKIIVKHMFDMEDKTFKSNEYRYRMINKTIKKQMLSFKIDNTKKIIQVEDFNELKENYNRVSVINYNTLMRAKFISQKYVELNYTKFILSNIVNNVNAYYPVNNFIFIPLDKNIFELNDFRRLFDNDKPTSYMYPTNIHYLLRSFVLRLFNKDVENSLLDKLDPSLFKYTYFIFNIADKYIYYNLGEILKLKINPLKINKHLNILSNSAIGNLPEFTSNISKYGEEGSEEEIVDESEDDINNENVNPIFDEIASQGDYTPKPKTPVFQKELSTEIDTFIDENKNNLTSAQIDKIKNIANKHLEIPIKINNEIITLEELLAEDKNELLKVEEEYFEHLENLDVPDYMKKSTINKFNEEYIEKILIRDIAESLLSFSSQGIFLTDLKIKEERTEINKVNHLKVTLTYRNKEGKFVNKTIPFSIPQINENGEMLINGSVKTLRHQFITKPIVKINETTVSLSSFLNKTIVEKMKTKASSFGEHIKKLINKNTDNNVKVVYGSNKIHRETKVSYEYYELAKFISSIEFKEDKSKFIFNYNTRFENYDDNTKELLKSLEKDYGTFVGYNNEYYYFVNINGFLNYYIIEDKTILEEETTFLDYFYININVPNKPLADWVNLKILNKKFPMIFVLAYRYGFSHILDYLDINYKVFNNKEEKIITDSPSDTVVKFKDFTLVFPRGPLYKSLFTNGLTWFKFDDIYLEDMEVHDTYLELLLNKDISINFLKGINNFFDLFLDPKTKEILARMGEPTNMKDLLIRATTMLVEGSHLKPSSRRNFRTRSYEKIPYFIYNELARAINEYNNAPMSINIPISIKEHQIMKDIVDDTLVDNTDIINPIHQIKMLRAFSFSGPGGRTDESFVEKDREYPEDGLGVMSEATVDSGKVSMNRIMSVSPQIADLNGMFDEFDENNVEDLTPDQLLSITALLFPGATNNDGKR
jgi:hypothetical protein